MARTKFSDPSDQEQAWLQAQLDALPAFIEAYSPDDAERPVNLDSLDRVFGAWLAQDVQDNAQVNAAINIVGICFGQFLVESAGFRWVIASDKQGADLAVLALPGRGDVLVYPANFVAKRWERKESNFIASAYNAIRQQVEQINARGDGGNRRPWWRLW